jgi:hypothetical protein
MNIPTFLRTKATFVGIGFAIFAFFIFYSVSAQTGIFQFSEGEQNYKTALAIAVAQEAESAVDVEQKVNLDEDFTPEDFGLNSVGLLPTNPFYFLKDARRGFTNLFTFDDLGKAERKLQFASERIVELQSIAERENVDPVILRSAFLNFQAELDALRGFITTISETASDEESKDLARKLMNAVVKYEKILGKLEQSLPTEVFGDVRNAQNGVAGAFGSAFDLVDADVASEEIVRILDEQKGSEFKQFKNLEFLKNVSEKVPKKAKDAIKIAEKDALSKLHSELERLEDAKRAIFEDFIKEIGGNEVSHLEILGDLEVLPLSEDVRNILLKAKEETLTRTQNRVGTFIDNEQKDRYFEQLGNGRIQDFRVVNELENNLSAGVLAGLGIRQKAEDGFKKKLDEIDSNEGQKEEFFDQVILFHDTRSFSVFDEIESLIPEDKKDFFSALKQKAVEEIKNDIARSNNELQRDAIFKALAGDRPEDFKSISSIENIKGHDVENEIFEGIRAALIASIRGRVDTIQDEERFRQYEDRVKNNEAFFGSSSSGDQLNSLFNERRIIFESPDKAIEKIVQAERVVGEFSALVDSLPFEESFGSGGFDPLILKIEQLLSLAESKIEIAHVTIEYGDNGRTFKLAEDAIRIANDGIRFAEEYKSGKKVVRCPFISSPSASFCSYGRIVNEIDSNGCELPPRCIFDKERESRQHPTDPLICGGFAGYECAEGFRCEIPIRTGISDAFGKCIPFDDRVTCSAYFEGYVYDNLTNTCRFESLSGCYDPFIYKTSASCEAAHGIGVITNPNPVATSTTICPLLPTVDFCPAGMRKVVSFTSQECGTYYKCEGDILPPTIQCNYNGICDSDEAYWSCPGDCSGSSKNWVSYTWVFSDGQTEQSQILNRNDKEYLDYIELKGKECRQITKSQFFWPPRAGDDSPENWERFGIPDCSGSGLPPSERCDAPAECKTESMCYTSGFYWYDSVCNRYSKDTGCSGLTSRLICDANPECYWNDYSSPVAYSPFTTGGYCEWRADDPLGTDCSIYLSQNSCQNQKWCSWTGSSCVTSGGTTGGMQKCFYPDATKDGKYVGYTVWCESDYYNCHYGEPSGDKIDLAGVSLGAPNNCESWGTVPVSCSAQASEATCQTSGCKWYLSATHNDGPHCDDYAHGDTLSYPYKFPESGNVCNDKINCLGYCKTVKSYTDNAADNAMCEKHWPGSTSGTGYCGDNYCDSYELSNGSCKLDCGSVSDCKTTPANCTSESDCKTAGNYWCSNKCQTTACVTTPPPTTPPTTTPPTPPTIGSCPSGYHYHSEGGGFCEKDVHDGICYNSTGTTVITCPYDDGSMCDGTADTSEALCTVNPVCKWDYSGNYCYPDASGYCTATTESGCTADSACAWDSSSNFCYSAGYSGTWEDCSNGVDDDGDGLIDGADPSCTGTGSSECVSKYTDATCSTTTNCCWYSSTGSSSGDYCYYSSSGCGTTGGGTTSNCSQYGSDWHYEYEGGVGIDVCFNGAHDQYVIGNGSIQQCTGSSSPESGCTKAYGETGTCNPATSDYCTTESQCSGIGYYWCNDNNSCHANQQSWCASGSASTGSSSSGGSSSCNYDNICDSGEDPAYCGDCSGGGGSGGGSTTSCYSISSESDCSAASCVWYTQEGGHSDGPHCDDSAHGGA